jgi:hypothetical protein
MSDPLKSYTPSVGMRLFCWFGIYFGAQLPFVLFIYLFWAFPIGLGTFVLSIVPGLETLPLAKVIAYALAYAFYLCHFILSLVTLSKRVFFVLMVILIIVVCLNFSGCGSDMAGLGQIKG